MLGYIFEKYINQKQMGAYYTKEDITEYIGKNTILPFLFDQARSDCRVAFEGEHTVWQLLAERPRRATSIPPCATASELPLPENIAPGVEMCPAGDWNSLRRPSMPCPRKSGARWLPAASVAKRCGRNWRRARCGASTTSSPTT